MKRNSNIELLRIISILLIVVSHYTVHNGVVNSTLPVGINRFILEISVLGNIGTIIFVIITGYFSINQERSFKMKKIILLYLEVLFYSLGIYLIFLLIGIQSFSLKIFIHSLLPITFKNYWFISVYILLYIFIPYINILLNSLKRKEHLLLILLSILFFSILRTITTKDYYGNELIQFIMFYTIGAYLRKYKDNFFSNKKNNMIVLITSIITLVFSVIVIDYASLKYNFLSNHSTYFFSRTSIVSILFSIALFNLFANKEEKNNDIINLISSCVLGVYLISDNFLIRKILWIDILKVPKYVNSYMLIPHMLCSVAIVFIACIAIEYIRKNTIEKLNNKVINNINYENNKIYLKFKKIMLNIR